MITKTLKKRSDKKNWKINHKNAEEEKTNKFSKLINILAIALITIYHC
jgi:hypothetical protein